MKRIAMFVTMIALLAFGASAIQISSLDFGDDNQDRVKNVIANFKITNNNTAQMTSIQLSLGGGAETSKFDIKFKSPPTSLSAGQSVTVTANATIPLDHDSVDSALKEIAKKIGTLTVTGTVGTTQDSATANVNMQAVNQLRIRKARVECGSKSENVDDGDKVENLKPGTDCTLEIEVENEFNSNDRNNQKTGDIQFTSLNINVDSDDNDIDIDEGDEIDDLDADDQDIYTADLEIEDDANDGTISIDVTISATDENGAKHGEAFRFRLEVDRLTHDIQIRRLELSPSRVNNCKATTAQLTVSMLNQGKRNEDEVAIEARSTDLAYTEKKGDIELDEDDSTSATLTVPVSKETAEGVYRIDVTTFFDDIAQSNTGSVEMTVDECKVEEDEPAPVVTQPQEGQQTTVTVPQATVTPTAGQSQAAPKKESTSAFAESKAYVALLVVLIVLIAGGLAVMATLLIRKKN